MTIYNKHRIFVFLVIALAIAALVFFFLSDPKDTLTKLLSGSAFALALYYFTTIGMVSRALHSLSQKIPGMENQLSTIWGRMLSAIFRASRIVCRRSNVKYIFLIGIIIFIYSTIERAPFASNLWLHKEYIALITIISGVTTLLLKKNALVPQTGENEGVPAEQERAPEFASAFPRLGKIPFLKHVVRWMYKEGWGYGTTVVCIFLIGLILHVWGANWSRGYTQFHSGESQFYTLIKAFSSGDYEAIYQRTQSIVIYALGLIDRVFQGTLTIFSLRLVISLIAFTVNFFLLANLRKLKALAISKKATLYILLGFSFSYTILFYSSVIRPDIIILTLFNLFLYEYLKNGVARLPYLILLSALAMSFKGNGVLVLAILITLVNFEIAKVWFREKIFPLDQFFWQNLTTLTLTYLLFLMMSPLYFREGGLFLFETLSEGAEKLGAGHYGIFATNRGFIPLYADRLFHFIIFFSPLIVLYFLGALVYLKNSIRLYGKRLIGSPRMRGILIVLLSLAFFFFMFTKPIQFYRYYFPFITVFLVITFSVISRIKLRGVAPLCMVAFMIYNSYFMRQQFMNARLRVDFSTMSPLYRESGTRQWMLPPSARFDVGIVSIDELPPRAYLLITEQDKYTYDRILRNPEHYNDGDFAGLDREELKKRLEFYARLGELRPVYSSGENTTLGVYLPYDVWYMTNPNYYLYQKI